ncbi:MAG: GFA family protein [Gammaproteobacteria bacterium]|nr:GFA family protein [Gammaproteobacteria bacterium]
MTTTPLAGGCFCGAVRYEVSGVPLTLCYCHCESCRRAAGSPVVAWGTFERGGFRVTRGIIAELNSSAQVTRGFCARCGSCLTYAHEARSGEIDVTLATLDDAAQLAPRKHVFVAEKLPWVRIEDGLPQFAGSGAGGSSTLP